MKPKIFIHPGIGKTATSAIQRVGMTQLDGLLRYCPFGLVGDVHNLLADIHDRFDKDVFLRELEGIKALDKNYNYLISSEFLCYSSDENIKFLTKELLSAGFDLEIVFVFREYSSLLLSTYLQTLKSGHNLLKGETFEGFVSRNLQSFKYDFLVGKWTNDPRVSVKILNFDSNKSGFVEYFFESLGVTSCDLIHTNEIINDSLIPECIPLILMFDSVESTELARAEFIKGLLAFSKEYSGYSSSGIYKESIKPFVERLVLETTIEI
jgi:hypothetical protein